MEGQPYLNEDRAAGETGPVTPSLASLSLTHSLSKHLLTVQLAGHCPGQWKGKWAPTSSCPGSSGRADLVVPGTELARMTLATALQGRPVDSSEDRELQSTGSPSRPRTGSGGLWDAQSRLRDPFLMGGAQAASPPVQTRGAEQLLSSPEQCLG